tara:strand:+ start:773 stop:1255 length:483 start_codon:yes stop_codon:yes gene_type:complete
MKKEFYYGLLMMVGFALISLSCSSDDDGSSIDNSQQIAQIESITESGTWRITNFNDSGQDYTSDFTGYDFTFASDGTLTASNGTTTLDGTWSITSDSSSDDDSNDDDDIEFNIFFPVSDSNDFEELNDDWDIVSTSATKIELIDISSDNGDTDRLAFEKN